MADREDLEMARRVLQRAAALPTLADIDALESAALTNPGRTMTAFEIRTMAARLRLLLRQAIALALEVLDLIEEMK
jgi:hypothetical protein